jgi:lysophospholipase
VKAPLDRRSIPAGMGFDLWTAEDGWLLRQFGWPQPGDAKGSILFLTGRGDFVEKYLEALGHWHDRGWTIAGFDWRGQGGSGRILADPLICHLADFEPLVRDLGRFIAKWSAATPGPHIIVAHSMGAHLALRVLVRRLAGVHGAVLCSPMIDIRVKQVPGWSLGAAARVAGLFGLSERRVWHRDVGDVGGRMTSCPERRADKAWWKASKPEIACGPPSWGWVRAARKSIARLRRADLSTVRIPVLLLASERDPIVDVDAIRRVAARLPEAELITFPGSGHELLREADERRLTVLARIDGFLGRLCS